MTKSLYEKRVANRERMRKYREGRRQRDAGYQPARRCAICWGNCVWIAKDDHVAQLTYVPFSYGGREYLAHEECIKHLRQAQRLIHDDVLKLGVMNSRTGEARDYPGFKFPKRNVKLYKFTLQFFRVMEMLNRKALTEPGCDYLKFVD